MKRCIAAFLILYSALFDLLMKSFLNSNKVIKDTVKDIVAPLLMEIQINPDYIATAHCNLIEHLKTIEFFDEFEKYRNGLQKQGKYLSNVTRMIQNMLLYLRGTKQQLWNLHLAAQDSFVKYFFSLDLQNYARMAPTELSLMYDIKNNDPVTWEFLENNFCCKKSEGPFIAIGVDHALEQVNKELKDIGGIKGLSDSELDKFCLIAPVKAALITRFSKQFALNREKCKTNVHYEDTGSHRSFHYNALSQYINGLNEFLDCDLANSDCVFNIMTHSVLDDDEDLLEVESIGEKMYDTFIDERKIGPPKSVWDTMTKRKLVTFQRLNKSIKVKVKNKIISLKEERGLMHRLLVISRVRTDLDISELFAKHEFSVTPRALFNHEGNPLKCTNKSDFLNGIDEVVKLPAGDIDRNEDCVALDGMGFVNQLNMTNIHQLQDLVCQFTKRMESETATYSVVILVFDSYDSSISNLKQQTWNSRHDQQVQYKLTATTVIKNIKLKELLSHPENKRKMTEFFANDCVEMLKTKDKRFVVTYGTTIIANIPGWTDFSHKHLEADTLLICVINKVAELWRQSTQSTRISIRLISPDTDVLMLALNFLAMSGTSIEILFELLNKNRRQIRINQIIEHFGLSACLGFLGVYIYTGCDQIGKFNTITKARAFQTYLMILDENRTAILNSLIQLGQETAVSTEIIHGLTKFAILLYTSKRKKDNERYSDYDDIGALRWVFHTKYAEENDALPPTAGALRFHILRSNYLALTWKRLSMSFDPELPDCTYEHGWNTEDGCTTAVMTDQLPAPEFSIELTSCHCKATHCSQNQCSCRRNHLRCTEVCTCIGCENEDYRFIDMADDEDEH